MGNNMKIKQNRKSYFIKSSVAIGIITAGISSSAYSEEKMI
jgi:hypothetical protein